MSLLQKHPSLPRRSEGREGILMTAKQNNKTPKNSGSLGVAVILYTDFTDLTDSHGKT
jgi:hypothetical protein